MNDRLRQLPTFPTAALERRKQELKKRGLPVFDFSTAATDEPPPQAVRAALADALGTLGHSAPPDGQPALRLAAARYLRRRFGVGVDADLEVLPVSGSDEAIFHLPQVLVQVPSDKDLVLYGEPAWPVFELGALFAEAWTYAVPLGDSGYQLDPELVPEATLRRAAMVCLSNPHDPTGQCLSDARLKAWVAARDQYGFALVSDEAGADLWFGEPRPRCVLEFGRKGCLAVHSLHQRSGLSVGAGFLAGDAELLAHYRRFRAGMGLAPSDFVQAASAVAWDDDAHVAERRRRFGEKRRLLLAHFDKLGLRAHSGTASLFLWLEVPAGTTDVAYTDRCAEAGIVVAPGSCFGRGQQRRVRVSLAPSEAECAAAIKVWPR